MQKITLGKTITHPALKKRISSNKSIDKTGNFSKLLKKYVSEVNEMQLQADKKIDALVTGKNISVDDVMTSVQEANMAFQLLLQIRNKLTDAYKEIMRTSVG